MLKDYLGENGNGVAEREIPAGCIVGDVMTQLGIP